MRVLSRDYISFAGEVHCSRDRIHSIERPDCLASRTKLYTSAPLVQAPCICSVAGTIGSDIGSEWKCHASVSSRTRMFIVHIGDLRDRYLEIVKPSNWSDHTGRSSCRWSSCSCFYFHDSAIGISPAQQCRHCNDRFFDKLGSNPSFHIN